MATLTQPAAKIKDPNATLNYTFDWSNWLPSGVTVSSATITTDLTTGTTTTDDSTVTVELSGGTAGTTYTVQCRVTFSSGEVDDVTGRITVKEQ